MPPSLIAALCTGPVTMPWQWPARQASAAASRLATVEAALAGAGTPGDTATAAGSSCRTNRPPGAMMRSGAGRCIGSPRRSAAASSVAASAKSSSSASQERCSARAHSSGPTPAGSPGTSASRGRGISAAADGSGGGPDVDEGFAAHLAQEAVPLVLELALADGLARLVAAVLGVDVGLAGAGALDNVPAGLAAERRRHFVVLQRGDLVAELRAEGVVDEPAEAATRGGRAAVFGALAGHLGEVRAAGDFGADAVDAGLGRGVVAAH